MIIRKAYKYRLKTNRQIEPCLFRFAGCCRFVWNKALALQKERLASDQKCLPYNDMAAELVKWKLSEEASFLKESHSQALQQTLKNLDKALKEAFDKKNPKKFPRFKKRGQHDSFRYPQGFKLDGAKIFLPKIGWVGFRKSRETIGIPKNVTVSKTGKHWFVSIQTEIEIAQPVHPADSVVGIDLGITKFATLSNGDTILPLNSFRKLEKKLKRVQRSLSRKKKFSCNWKKQQRKVQNLHTKIADTRKDFLHKASTIIASENQAVIMENLKVSNMSASAKGTVEDPGKNIKAKSGLNKSILDQGWFEFRRQIEYKLNWRGGKLVLVPPQYTSQTCSFCGHVSKGNRTSQSRFVCVECSHAQNADLNAALNILAAGLAVLACGDIKRIAA